MSGDLTIFNQASAMARHAAERHRVIAENVANADTPGYKAQDLPPFDAAIATRPDDDLARTRMFRAAEVENARTSPNGNSVGLEDQMVRAADATAQHEMALAIYRQAMDLLRLSVRVGR